MDYTQFLLLREELSLIAVLLLTFVFDLFFCADSRKGGKHVLNRSLPLLLLLVHTVWNVFPQESGEAFAGMYRSNTLISIVKSILNIGTLIVFLMADTWLKKENTRIKQGEFHFLTLSTLLGMYIMLSAQHFLLFFIGLELASVPMAALVCFDKYKYCSVEAGAKYILLALFSSGLLLYGLSLIYGTTGSLYYGDIRNALTPNALSIAGFVLFFSGIGFKLSLVPFHLWTADVYEGAPVAITGYLSVISKGAAAVALLSILTNVFAPLIPYWQELLVYITILSITIANIFAIRQQNIKRFLAFSSISQAGYLMLGVLSGNSEGMASLVYYLLVYIMSNLAIFTIVSLIENHSQKTQISDYNNLYESHPKLSFLMTIALFSLAGIPPFAGFFSKFFIFMTAFQAGFHLTVFIALLNTVISLYYYLLIVKAMYISANPNPVSPFRSDNHSRIALVVCTAGIIGLGLVSIVFQHINTAALNL